MAEHEEPGPEPRLWWLCLCLQVVPKHVAFGESHEGSLEGSDLPPFENAAPQVAGDGGVLSLPSTAWLRVALAKVCKS